MVWEPCQRYAKSLLFWTCGFLERGYTSFTSCPKGSLPKKVNSGLCSSVYSDCSPPRAHVVQGRSSDLASDKEAQNSTSESPPHSDPGRGNGRRCLFVRGLESAGLAPAHAAHLRPLAPHSLMSAPIFPENRALCPVVIDIYFLHWGKSLQLSSSHHRRHQFLSPFTRSLLCPHEAPDCSSRFPPAASAALRPGAVTRCPGPGGAGRPVPHDALLLRTEVPSGRPGASVTFA